MNLQEWRAYLVRVVESLDRHIAYFANGGMIWPIGQDAIAATAAFHRRLVKDREDHASWLAMLPAE
ncbi:MAG TPA: hypothetical protein VMB34_18210 [Acetobacteraceae bacterium]|nr:hypothetical protein [Acetobacteraceae bacterium]